MGSASPLADAEIVALLSDSLAALGFPDFVTLLNHRQLIGGIARVSGLDEAAAGSVYRAIDKFDKIGADGVREELLRSGVVPTAAAAILTLVQTEGEAGAVLNELAGHLASDERACAAIANLRAIIAALENLGISPARYTVAPRLARGLSYYTGLVFEAITPHWPEGSLLGGGRYDELIGQFAGRPIPTVGLAFGIDRLHDVMEQLNLGPRSNGTAVAFVTIFGPEQSAASMALAQALRKAGINTLLSLEPQISLGKQLKEADRRGARYALLLGPDELARGEVVLKDLRSGEQHSLERAQLIEVIRASA